MSEGRRFTPKKSIKNWSAYNKGLQKRYDITVHLNREVLEKPLKATGLHNGLHSSSDDAASRFETCQMWRENPSCRGYNEPKDLR